MALPVWRRFGMAEGGTSVAGLVSVLNLPFGQRGGRGRALIIAIPIER